jgi:hypothetical protein
VETPEQKAASYGTVAVICGVAPVPLALLWVIPPAACLTLPASFMAMLCAIGFGVVGIIQARKARVPAMAAWGGLVLGLCWLAFFVVAGVWMEDAIVSGVMKMQGEQRRGPAIGAASGSRRRGVATRSFPLTERARVAEPAFGSSRVAACSPASAAAAEIVSSTIGGQSAVATHRVDSVPSSTNQRTATESGEPTDLGSAGT